MFFNIVVFSYSLNEINLCSKNFLLWAFPVTYTWQAKRYWSFRAVEPVYPSSPWENNPALYCACRNVKQAGLYTWKHCLCTLRWAKVLFRDPCHSSSRASPTCHIHPILLFLPHIVNFSTVLWWVMTYLDTHIWIVCSQDWSCEFTQVPTLMKSRIWTSTLYSCWFICSMRHSVKSNQIQRVSHRQQWPHHSASWECAGTFTISTSFDSLALAWTSSLSSDNINLWWLRF